ncbi:A/G-specific adenine glycosylase [Aquamicrobium segne]|uniref:Adenine DNA glycosylase n=1 Tax=Aquamicrobium segne TaxID=469547 RepID=A0ABW0GWL9_9HYPH
MALQDKSRKPGIATRLLNWYDLHHRDLPWRIGPADLAQGKWPDPYRVWLSEIMLQQTTVEAVKSYFTTFTKRWPDIFALAAASQNDIMKAWAGLGYYSRARNLKACADLIAAQGGIFPDTDKTLRALPGIGPYTAGAIAAIAFNRPAAVVDGNVERVISRLYRIQTALPQAKPQIRILVEQLVPAARPGDFAQAMMDLGATICTPRRPKCMLCPLSQDCTALVAGDPELYPVKLPKPEKPLRRGAAFVVSRADGAVLLRQRPSKGLLGGMSEVPTTNWTARQDGKTSLEAAPFSAQWEKTGQITHVFTHFRLKLDIYHTRFDGAAPADHFWSVPGRLHDEALPTVMKKAIEAALPGATKRKQN